MNRRLLIALVALLALVAAGCGVETASSRGADSFVTRDGDTFALESLEGQAALVLFWAPG